MGEVGAIFAFLGGSSLYRMSPEFPFWMGSALVILSAFLVLIFKREPKEYDESPDESPGMMSTIKEIMPDEDKSTIRLLLATLSWFRRIAYQPSDHHLNRIEHADHPDVGCTPW
jgi:hypothetical protein